MITRTGKLIEKLKKFDPETPVRILDLSDDSAESGVYQIKSAELNELVSFNTNRKMQAVTITFEQYPDK